MPGGTDRAVTLMTSDHFGSAFETSVNPGMLLLGCRRLLESEVSQAGAGELML